MKLKLVGPDMTGLECDALVLPEFEGSPRVELSGELAAFRESGEITGKSLELTLLHNAAGYKARRVLLAGAGKREKFEVSSLWKLSAAAARFLKGKGVKCAAVALEAGFDSPAHVSATVQAVIEACWEPDQLKTNADKDGVRSIEELTISVPEATASLEAALQAGRIIGEAANLARDISVEPPNKLTPLALAAHAQAMARANGLTCEVLDQDRMRQLCMGALLGVAQGSAEPGAMIVMEYTPDQSAGEGGTTPAKLALIGKGVTFDTGGISIKPADKMEQMKYDMAGGAAMIGAMRAIALLKPKVRVISLVCAAENMPDGKAYKPGDVLTAMPSAEGKPGKTIEIINTDAEGRLVLADGLTYAKQLGATHLIDAATLTGACVVALGIVNAGIFSNDEAAYEKFKNALAVSGEKFWRLPLDDEYKDMIKSDIGDIKNTGGRYGGASTAAEFLHTFAEDTPWIHLDIAGAAWIEDSRPYIAKGPSGIAMRSILEWVRSY